MEILFLILGAIAAIGLLVLYNAFAYGYVVYKFWYWFILAAFPQLPELTLPHAIGLMFFISLFRSRDMSDSTINGVEIKKKANWAGELLAPWIIIFIAWFVHLFL